MSARKVYKYFGSAKCGFCPHFGKKFSRVSEDFCQDCPVTEIKDALEEIRDFLSWEHRHKYFPDDDLNLRTCEHCEHSSVEHTKFHSDFNCGDSWCELDTPNEQGDMPMRNLSETCGKWERAKDKTVETEAVEDVAADSLYNKMIQGRLNRINRRTLNKWTHK